MLDRGYAYKCGEIEHNSERLAKAELEEPGLWHPREETKSILKDVAPTEKENTGLFDPRACVLRHFLALNTLISDFSLQKMDLTAERLRTVVEILFGKELPGSGYRTLTGKHRSGGKKNSPIQQTMRWCDDLKDELATREAANSIDPFYIAADFSLRLLKINPFHKGNGRLARLIIMAIIHRYTLGLVLCIGMSAKALDEFREHCRMSIDANDPAHLARCLEFRTVVSGILSTKLFRKINAEREKTLRKQQEKVEKQLEELKKMKAEMGERKRTERDERERTERQERERATREEIEQCIAALRLLPVRPKRQQNGSGSGIIQPKDAKRPKGRNWRKTMTKGSEKTSKKILCSKSLTKKRLCLKCFRKLHHV